MSEIYLSGVYIYILIEFIVRCHCLRPIENNIVLSLRISSEKQGIASEELENGTRQVYDKKNKRAKKIYKYIFASVFVIPVFVVRCIGDERKKKEKKKGREKKNIDNNNNNTSIRSNEYGMLFILMCCVRFHINCDHAFVDRQYYNF